VLTPFLPITIGVLLAAAPPGTGAAARSHFNAEEVLAKTRAAYAALTSYADSGTVLDESSGFTDRSTFRTFLTRTPRKMFIEYRAVASEYKSGHRLQLTGDIVFWIEKDDLQSWSGKTQDHITYPATDTQAQVNALKNAGYSTKGISILVPSFFYTKAGLASPVHAAEEVEADGFETVNGRKCYRLLGVERWRYPSGRETGVRAITLWVDAETYLIHKIFQDTPKAMPRNEISRRTTTLKHQMNPTIDPAQFKFVVPAG
jgi:outer membrane lipoprotein-sorting protein